MKEILKNNPINSAIAICAIIVVVVLIIQTVLFTSRLSHLEADIASIRTYASSSGNNIRTLNDDISSIKATLATINTSITSMKNADVFSINAIRLTSGDTWMLPVASAAWSGR